MSNSTEDLGCCKLPLLVSPRWSPDGAGVEITLGHRTWPGIFTTWLVINFSNFKLCPVILWRKSWKLFSSFLGFQVIYQRSKNNKLKDVYLPCNLIKGLGQFLITESPLKTMKNAFYFTLKAILVLKIFKFLFWLFGHVEKTAWLERLG